MSNNSQKGVSLIIAFFIMVIILAVVLSLSTLLYSEIKVIRNIGNSVVVFYAADSGVEKVLYYDRKVLPELPDEKVAARGLCSMCQISNPNGCAGAGQDDSSIYCKNCQTSPLDPELIGCEPDVCDNCEVSFDTDFDDRNYHVAAAVSPSLDGESSDFEIKSKGSFSNVERQIEINSTKAQAQGAINIENAAIDEISILPGQSISISADISTTNSRAVISRVFAAIWDIDENTHEVDLSCVSGPCYDSEPDYSSGQWSVEWTAGSIGVYYISITAQDSLENEATESISNNAAGQSFEVYPSGSTSYPTLASPNVSRRDNDSAVITANIYDISGVSSARATIKDSNGIKIESDWMQKITGNSFATSVINITGYSGTYTVDISAIDNFLIKHTYVGATSFTVGPPGPNWLADYAYRKEITISNTNIDADLDNFPTLIHFTDADIGGHLYDTTTCNDIRFTDSNGTALLKYEKESCSVAGGTATANFWVKIPNLYHTPTGDQNKIYVYYGKVSDIDGQEITNVWDADYKAVYHLKETGTVNKWSDSTSNKNDGNNNGATATTGKISGAGGFDSNNYSYITSKKSIRIGGSNPFTIEAWVLPGDNPGSLYYPGDDYGRNIVSWGSPSCTTANFLYYDTESNRNRFESGYFCNDRYTDGNFPKNNWYNVASEYTGSQTNQSKLFINGNETTLTKYPGGYDTVNMSDSLVRIGFDLFDQGRYFNGIIDEVRISSAARSDDWIKFEYYNINEPDNEINFGAEETAE